MRTICWRTKRWKDKPCDDCNNGCASPRLPDCYVAVPVEELKKLEAAREQLYQYLDGKITEQEMLGLVSITGQIWKVANCKKWD